MLTIGDDLPVVIWQGDIRIRLMIDQEYARAAREDKRSREVKGWTRLLCQPLFTLLDILVEQKGHVSDDEREHDFREELGRMSEFHLYRRPDVQRERRVERSKRLV